MRIPDYRKSPLAFLGAVFGFGTGGAIVLVGVVEIFMWVMR